MINLREGEITRKHWLLLLPLIAVLVLALIILWLYFPLLINPGKSNGYTCSRSHIYAPIRLDFRGCKTVSGTSERVKIEPDGDTHVRLALDKQFKYLLTEQNYRRQAGDLIIEDMCRHKSKELIQLLAKWACHNYTSSFPNPTVGKRYEITGNYVIDDWHGSWAELHGIAEFKELN